jgi:2-polyprenyl-6-hydroxyphenyl methylase/3-demethylubiquinone-9 3-methyltransferase
VGCVKQLPTKALHYGTSSRIRPGAEIGGAFDGTWHHATPKTSAQNAVNMTTDNTLYDRFADTWWDEREWLFMLTALAPARFGYMRRVLLEELRLQPAGLRALDVGCGGGLLAEEFARLGFTVTGVDPSEASLATARRHAEQQGLRIEYQVAEGEALPFDQASFDVVYCCDVLEHVRNLDQVIAEAARVLRPGGIYLYDTINRTLASRVTAIWVLQKWSWTSIMPPDLHDWKMFIRPDELLRLLKRYGLRPAGIRGLKARANPLRILRALRDRKRGRLSYVEAFARLNIGESDDTSVQYAGYARKM